MKKSLLLLLVITVFTFKKGVAQDSIVPDLNEAYLDRLIDIAKANYPRVKNNEDHILAAKAAVERANMSYFEALNVSYIYQPNNLANTNTPGQSGGVNISSYNGIQAGVNLNIGALLERPFQVKEAKHQVAIAQDEKAEYLLTLTNEVKKRYYAYLLSVENLKLLTQTSLDAQNATSTVRRKFESGEETFDNYSKAQLNLRASYQAKMAGEAALLTAKADLESLLGEKLEDIK